MSDMMWMLCFKSQRPILFIKRVITYEFNANIAFSTDYFISIRTFKDLRYAFC